MLKSAENKLKAQPKAKRSKPFDKSRRVASGQKETQNKLVEVFYYISVLNVIFLAAAVNLFALQ